jgi:hypothetical protein
MSPHVILFDNLSAIFIHVYEASAAAGDEWGDCCLIVVFLDDVKEVPFEYD